MGETVAECYDGQSVFITGSTGFLGKVLLEKLLYSCLGLNKAYILVRPKKNMTAQERLSKILEQPLFARVKGKNPQALEKIVLIPGDISEPRLGIKAEDEELLIDKVSIVFHAAATVKFNEPLEVAMNINVVGTKNVLELSQRMKNIKTFVYVSTAYSNSLEDVIDEVLYPAPAALNEVTELIKIGISEEQTKQLIGKRPNTYTLTKALAENMIAENHGHVPTVIVRPTIVTCSREEPVAGWIDNWFGATGFINTISKGLTRVIFARPTNILDIIPVDYVSNLIIVAASKCISSQDVLVYNCSTSEINPLTLGHLMKLIIEDSYENKSYHILMPFMFFTSTKWVLTILAFMFQVIPAFLADVFLLVIGKNTRYKKMQAKVLLLRSSLDYFTSHSWVIRSSKSRALFNSLSPSDKEIFHCNPMDINWDKYVPCYLKGIRQFLNK